jgi:hypothetical protein
MSKFVDKLQRLSKSSTSPIGFHPAASESKRSSMLLIAGLSGVDVKEAKIVADSNADAGLILRQTFDIEAIRQAAKVMGDIPLGILVKDIGKEKADKLVSLGCDFVVFNIKMPVMSLHEEGIGGFLMIAPSLDQGLVRAINNLDVDGVFISIGEESFITVEYLLICHRFCELLDKPVIITLPSLVTRAELGSLWQTGIDGIVVPQEQPTEALAELRKIIDDLPRGARHRRGKPGVILPHHGGGIATEEDEEEEEEEET